MTATGSENYVTEYNYNNAQGKYTALLQKEIKTCENNEDENPLTHEIVSNVEQIVYTYDTNGNQIIKTADGKTETNTYDGLNQLIGFTDGETTEHVWDGNKQIIADVVNGQYYEANCYLRGTNLVATYHYQNGAKSEYTYYSQNAHGDVVNLTDADGAVIKSYTYDAFGVEKNIDDSDTNAFRYCGEYYDAETGTIYLRARYYNPTTGRFISRDSFAGRRSDPLSLNRYTYCRNNPVRYVDPSGHDAVDAASFMVNCPRPTHKVNSAWDAHYYTDWDNKFKQILDAPARVMSNGDVAHRNNVKDSIAKKGDSDYYKAWLQLPLDKLGISWNVPKEVVSSNEIMIAGLKPKLQPLARALLLNANENNIRLIITDGFRTKADQESATRVSGQGGTRKSLHEWGKAFDVHIWDESYEAYHYLPIRDYDDDEHKNCDCQHDSDEYLREAYAYIAQLKPEGLQWGGTDYGADCYDPVEFSIPREGHEWDF